MKPESLVIRIDEILSLGDAALSTRHHDTYTGGDYIDSAAMKGFRAAALSFIDRVYGRTHTHFLEFDSNTQHSRPGDVERGISILQVIRSEIDGGWLFTIKGMITAEVFSDFLEMAEHLLETGYKDPAAVMCGSVLEEHLRQLCQKHGIPVRVDKNGKEVPKKADRLNSDLAKAEIYSKLDLKVITAMLGIRNKAAHGEYNEYTVEQVRNMLNSVTEFMARVAV